MPIRKLNRGGLGNTENKVRSASKSLHRIMQYVGESSLKYARENGSFQDRTGNLRSSEGYTVTDNGKMIDQSGNEQFLDGSEGVSAGKSFRSELAARHEKRIVLIVSAGMDYAAEVESKGYDVLSGSELKAKEMVPRLLRKAGFKIS